jgi:hypothetical protein
VDTSIIPQNETEVKPMKDIIIAVCKIIVGVLVIIGFVALMIHIF